MKEFLKVHQIVLNQDGKEFHFVSIGESETNVVLIVPPMHVPLERFYGRNFPFLTVTNQAKFVTLEMIAEVKNEDYIDVNVRHLEDFLSFIGCDDLSTLTIVGSSSATQCIIPFCMQYSTVKKVILESPCLRNTISDQWRAKVDGIFSVPPICKLHDAYGTMVRCLYDPILIGNEEIIMPMKWNHFVHRNRPLTYSIDWTTFPPQIQLVVILMQIDKFTPVEKFNENLRNSYPFNECEIFEISGFGHMWDANKKFKEESVYTIVNSLVLPSSGDNVLQQHNLVGLISLQSRL